MLFAIYLLSREGAILTAKTGAESRGLIMIDSGHGGIDPGAVSYTHLDVYKRQD